MAIVETIIALAHLFSLFEDENDRVRSNAAARAEPPVPSRAWFEKMKTDPFGLSEAIITYVIPPSEAPVPCAVCHDLIDAPVATCRRCDTRAHEKCWRYTGRCPRFGCSHKPATPDELDGDGKTLEKKPERPPSV